MTYDAEHWLESTTRTILDYVKENLNTRVYDFQMEFPGAYIDSMKLPFAKTVIHFALDDAEPRPLGLGSGEQRSNYDPVLQAKFPQYAEVQTMTFDVGVWASDKSGGTTQRMRARQALGFLFGINNGGVEKFRQYSDGGDGGIEIRQFSGGRFVLDTSANNVRLYRMVDCMLVVRAYSRTPIPETAIPTVEDFSQDSGLTIIG